METNTTINIGEASRQTGLSPKTIRFYEEAGLLPSAARSASGYRRYGEADLARLRLIRRARLLGLPLPVIRELVEQAFSADCARFGEQLLATLAEQKAAIEARIAELQALRCELDALTTHVAHCCEGCNPSVVAAECGFCGLITQEKGGEPHGGTL